MGRSRQFPRWELTLGRGEDAAAGAPCKHDARDRRRSSSHAVDVRLP